MSATTHAARGKSARAKGQRAELEACRILSHWWEPDSKGKRAANLPFQRTRSGTAQGSGDIIVPGDFPFDLEVKSRAGWDWWSMLSGEESWVVWSWFGQAIQQSKRGRPLLLFTRMNRPWYAMLRGYDWFAIAARSAQYSTTTGPHGAVVIVRLDALTQIDPANVAGADYSERSE